MCCPGSVCEIFAQPLCIHNFEQPRGPLNNGVLQCFNVFCPRHLPPVRSTFRIQTHRRSLGSQQRISGCSSASLSTRTNRECVAKRGCLLIPARCGSLYCCVCFDQMATERQEDSAQTLHAGGGWHRIRCCGNSCLDVKPCFGQRLMQGSYGPQGLHRSLMKSLMPVTH